MFTFLQVRISGQILACPVYSKRNKVLVHALSLVEICYIKGKVFSLFILWCIILVIFIGTHAILVHNVEYFLGKKSSGTVFISIDNLIKNRKKFKKKKKIFF